jgi:hypothetical protein
MFGRNRERGINTRRARRISAFCEGGRELLEKGDRLRRK